MTIFEELSALLKRRIESGLSRRRARVRYRPQLESLGGRVLLSVSDPNSAVVDPPPSEVDTTNDGSNEDPSSQAADSSNAPAGATSTTDSGDPTPSDPADPTASTTTVPGASGSTDPTTSSTTDPNASATPATDPNASADPNAVGAGDPPTPTPPAPTPPAPTAPTVPAPPPAGSGTQESPGGIEPLDQVEVDLGDVT